MFDKKTVIRIDIPAHEDVTIAGHLPILPDGSAVEIDDVTYTIIDTSLAVNSETGDQTIYMRVR